MAFPVDRSLEFGLVSTKTPLFIDRGIKLTGLSSEMAFFMEMLAKPASLFTGAPMGRTVMGRVPPELRGPSGAFF